MKASVEWIRDPLAVSQGDILKVPAEKTGKLRLHLSPKSYSKLGLSVGETGRSDNYLDSLRKMLTDRWEADSYFLVTQAVKSSGRQSDAERLLENRRRETAMVEPPVASFELMPFEPYGKSAKDAMALKHAYGERIAEWLCERLSLEYRDMSNVDVSGPFKFDEALAAAADVTKVREATIPRTGSAYYGRFEGKKRDGTDRMTAEDARECVVPNLLDAKSYVSPSERIRATRKFAECMCARGALLLRPNAEAVRVLCGPALEEGCARASAMFSAYEAAWRTFLKKAKGDMDNVARRKSRWSAAARAVSPRKSDIKAVSDCLEKGGMPCRRK